MTDARRAVAMLVLCCASWGMSFPLMQIALAATARVALGVSPGTLAASDDLALRAGYNGVRFTMAAVVYAAVSWRSLSGHGRARETIGATISSLLFSAALLLQLLGLRWMLPSVSAVLTATCVVFTPLAQALIARRAVGARVWLSALVAMGGIALLASPDVAGAAARTVAVAPPWPYAGAAATLVAALLFTGQIFAIDRWAGAGDPTRFTEVTFIVAALAGLAGCVALGGGHLLAPSVLLALARDPAWAVATAFNVLASSVVAFHLVNRWQPRVPPAVASVVYCSEPLFALLWSLLLATERLTLRTATGGAIVLVAVLVVAGARRADHISARPAADGAAGDAASNQRRR